MSGYEETVKEREDEEIDLCILFRNFFQGLLRFWWLIAILMLVGGYGMYARATRFYTPRYRSTASFTVMTGDEDSGETYNFFYDVQSAGQMARTFPYILGSDLLWDAMRADLGVETINGSVSAAAVSESNLIEMSAVSSSPQDARAILESAIRVYPSVARFVIGPTKFNMIETPTVPTEPYNRPNCARSVVKGAAAGCGAGLMLLGVYALFKRTLQKPEELKNELNLPCLGQIPRVRRKARWKMGKKAEARISLRVLQNFKENLQGLQLKIERGMGASGGKVLLITSTSTAEGKSTLAMNLAYTAAEHGKRVLLVDGDLRKQDSRLLLTDQPGSGLAEVLAGDVSLEKAVGKHEDGGFWYLCGSKAVRRPYRLLSQDRAEEVFREMREQYDLILLDSPPAEMFADAGLLARFAESVLYVIRYDYVQKWRVLDSIAGLQGSGAKLMGYVFNEMPPKRGRYGYGRYGYGYGYGYYGYYGGSESEREARDEA